MLKTVGNPSTRFGNQTIENGNLVIATAGNGIDFSSNPSAPGATSELLDDYEEGTWTPTVDGSGTAGTATYTQQSGRYTKIGNRVFFSAVVTFTGHTGVGSPRLSLPFTVGASDLTILYASCSNYALTVSNILIGSQPNAGAAYSIFYQALVGGAAVSTIPMSANGSLFVSGHYEV
jgi:hypothetical protein